MVSKNTLLYNILIRDRCPGYENVDAEDLNAERIIEKLIAKEGNLNWIGDENLPYDYSCDLSDSKTCTMVEGPMQCTAVITSTETKVGALRVVVANTISEKLDYFFIPPSAIRELEKPPGGKKFAMKRCIRFGWSKKKDTYGRIESYRCESFEEMCHKSLPPYHLEETATTLGDTTQVVGSKGLKNENNSVQNMPNMV
jgi:hypothetical protein